MSTRLMDYGPLRILKSSGLILAVLLLALTLAACDTAEERAEEHYKTGMALLDKGDVERALIEFRNVFKLDSKHRGARLAYAEVQRERGNLREAYGQYLRLVEQHPEDLQGLLALSEIALKLRNWEELDRYSKKALAVAPDNLEAQSMVNFVTYSKGVRDEDDKVRADAVRKAKELLAKDPSLPSSHKVVIDSLIADMKWEAALSEIEAALQLEPDDLSLYQTRLGILQQLGDNSGIRETLEKMIEQFPDNEAIKQGLVSFYVRENDLDAAESFLRKQAEASDEPGPTGQLVGFLLNYRGSVAAKEELRKIIGAGRLSPVPFKTLLARLKYSTGDTSEAIAELEALTRDAARTAEIRDAETELARMQFQQGNNVEARRLVEKVLKEDPSHPGASKLKAAWLIQDDETGDALVLLRDALSKAPRDPYLLTLMAQAYDREGNQDLRDEMLSLAVEASDNAPEPTLRYAKALAAENKLLPAEGIIIDALRVQPTNVELLTALGGLYIRMEKYGQADDVVDRLKELGSEEAKNAALSLTAQKLSAQGRNDDLLSMLQGVAQDPDKKKTAEIAIFRTHLKEDGPEKALEYLDGLLKDAPEDPDFRYLRAGNLVMLGKPDEAEGVYRKLTEDYPQSIPVWVALYRLKLFQGDSDEAAKVLEAALKNLPDNPTLRVALAEQKQVIGAYEEAIAIYEDLYKANPNSVLVANNLASMLADHRSDVESLQRAFSIARRLRNADVPAMQDTYGWIAYRMGNYEESLPYLKKAADAISTDPTVQFHYGAALAANGKTEDAKAQLEKAESLLKPNSKLPVADLIKAELDKLNAEGVTPQQD